MTTEDIKKILLSPVLFRLDTVLSPRLVPLLYATGLAAILLWAVIHLFATFSRTFGDGLWGLLEIAVFGALALLVLRVACEMILVFFKSHETATRAVSLSRVHTDLMDEVREAIHDIADDDSLDDNAAEDFVGPAPARPVRRTARRSPPPAKLDI